VTQHLLKFTAVQYRVVARYRYTCLCLDLDQWFNGVVDADTPAVRENNDDCEHILRHIWKHLRQPNILRINQ
jgi:hypothetical protein